MLKANLIILQSLDFFFLGKRIVQIKYKGVNVVHQIKGMVLELPKYQHEKVLVSTLKNLCEINVKVGHDACPR